MKKLFPIFPSIWHSLLFLKPCRTDTVSLQTRVKKSDVLVILMRQHKTLLFNIHNSR